MAVRSLGIQVDARATTGAGCKCTISENRSASTAGSSTRNPCPRAVATTAAIARRERASRRCRRSSAPLRVLIALLVPLRALYRIVPLDVTRKAPRPAAGLTRHGRLGAVWREEAPP
jgi:hypothetical protein